jgi:transposase-like protein
VDTLILDLLDPEEARRPPMAMKDYSDEFKADAVALYESTPGALYKSIAADLGINRATLREWVLRDRERRGVTAAAPAEKLIHPGGGRRAGYAGCRGRALERVLSCGW